MDDLQRQVDAIVRLLEDEFECGIRWDPAFNWNAYREVELGDSEEPLPFGPAVVDRVGETESAPY
jgi:hypothetical protein